MLFLLVFFIFCFAPQSNEKWEVLGKVILGDIFPQDKQLIDDRLTIQIVSDREVGAEASFEYTTIRLSRNFIELMENNEYYMRSILAHEFSHIKLRHKEQFISTTWFGPMELDLNLWESNEINADTMALLALVNHGHNPCVVEDMMYKLIERFPMSAPPDSY